MLDINIKVAADRWALYPVDPATGAIVPGRAISTFFPERENAERDCRRAAACINVCVAIPTECLEALVASADGAVLPTILGRSLALADGLYLYECSRCTELFVDRGFGTNGAELGDGVEIAFASGAHATARGEMHCADCVDFSRKVAPDA